VTQLAPSLNQEGIMRIPAVVALSLLTSSAAVYAQLPRVSAAEVHRACRNPQSQARSPKLAAACSNSIPQANNWSSWSAVANSAQADSLAFAVQALSSWTPEDVPLVDVVRRVQRQPNGAVVIESMFAAVERNEPDRLVAAVATLPPDARANILLNTRRRIPDAARINTGLLAPGDRIANDEVTQEALESASEARQSQTLSVIIRSPNASIAPELAGLRAAEQIKVFSIATTGWSTNDFLLPDFLDPSAAGTVRQAMQAEWQQAQGSAASLAAIPLTQQSALLWGATDYVVGRAEAQMQRYFLEQFSSGFCLQHQAVLPSSCQVLNGTALRNFRPGLGMLRQAVRRDLDALPATLLRSGMLSNTIPPQYWDQLNVAASGALLTVDVLRGADPIQALRRMADSILPEVAAVSDAPVAQLLGQFAAFNGGWLDASGTLLDSLPATLRNEQVLQRLLLAFAINQRAHLKTADRHHSSDPICRSGWRSPCRGRDLFSSAVGLPSSYRRWISERWSRGAEARTTLQPGRTLF
jgi:hypothetical protein